LPLSVVEVSRDRDDGMAFHKRVNAQPKRRIMALT
jgi:hypothetical protein